MNYHVISSLRCDPSITIFLGMPNDESNNKKYAIVLKNLLTDIRKELRELYRENDYPALFENLDAIENEFLPSVKSESSIFFVSSTFNEQVVVPFIVESSYHISDRFTTKKLLRQSNDYHHYYVLTLNDTESRLLEYQNGTLIGEMNDGLFPVTNSGYWTRDRLLNSMGSVRTNYQKEFYKSIDSHLQAFLNQSPHPVILAGVAENAAIYRSIANNNELIIGELNGNFTIDKGESLYDIGKMSAQLIDDHIFKQKELLIDTLDQFASKGRLEQDIIAIYMAAIKGRGQELIVEANYYEEAIITDGQVLINEVDRQHEDYVEDIVNEIIYQVMRYGGEVVFADKEALKSHGSIVLKTRY
ncbi:hypothetical protein I6N95_25000 [Vagococcus sp. BWB3-3]|uniref:Uncharacterized protein n=1 Tax=Vagococcus allomyrinae TaxID=2794353 RepID=A0A940PAY8_9ENTE|nr:hypothetical protein [Vagococcus allomyrinae]MBP1044270.1 hypothetical protein [Vagococcus allomyrinae]